MANPSPRRRPRQQALAPSQSDAGATLRYIESSALLSALLEQDDRATVSLRAAGTHLTSALTLAEASRAIVRARVGGRLTAEQERAALRGLRTLSRRLFVVDVTATILARAGRRFPVEPVRTRDAVHLATVELLEEDPPLVTVVTRDERVRANAVALGYAIE